MDIILDHHPHTVQTVIQGCYQEEKLDQVKPGGFHVGRCFTPGGSPVIQEMIDQEMKQQDNKEDNGRNSLK